MIASTGSLRLVNELVGLRRLLGQGPDGVLEDLAFAASHGAGRLGDLADLMGRHSDGLTSAAVHQETIGALLVHAGRTGTA
jgi:hypothetical protein